MIGVFDSGVGGLNSVYELKRLLPRADIVYLADRENAPYGTKSEDELISLVTEDIRRLRDLGAVKILIACCTASTVWEKLTDREREISTPIIRPAACRAIETSTVGIAVIATEATVKSHAFSREISAKALLPVSEIATGELVSLVEGGARDGKLTKDSMTTISEISEKINKTCADTLVLGCTHFSHLEKTLAALTKMKTVSPAREGALSIARECEATEAFGGGKVTYL